MAFKFRMCSLLMRVTLFGVNALKCKIIFKPKMIRNENRRNPKPVQKLSIFRIRVAKVEERTLELNSCNVMYNNFILKDLFEQIHKCSVYPKTLMY